MTKLRQAVLVGAGQASHRGDDPAGISPMGLMEQASRLALADAGIAPDLPDSVAVVRSFSDSAPLFRSPFGDPRNPPLSLARRLGADPRLCLLGPVGGHSPQLLVNEMAHRIAVGECDIALIASGEALHSQSVALKLGLTPDWSEACEREPETLGPDPLMVTAEELRHNIGLPVNVYPLFETALMAGQDRSAHLARIAALWAGFSGIASANDHAAQRSAVDAADVLAVTARNRMICWPYTRAMCSTLGVDQAAAIVLMAEARADDLGIGQARRVYLHGNADCADKPFVSERMDYVSSPAIRLGAHTALDAAGLGTGALGFIDLYSCFPSAVQIAAREIGLALDDPRGLTLTGGLCAFGGPGNGYSLHAIAEMVQRCRTSDAHGLVFANGGYLTKHSFGVYGRRQPATLRDFRTPPKVQAQLDALPAPQLSTLPNGPGRIESYSIDCERGEAKTAIVIARLDTGERALANSDEPALIARLMATDHVGAPVTLEAARRCNQIRLASSAQS